jgi:hypothetical protein
MPTCPHREIFMRDADEAADVLGGILRARRVPCICPRQHDTKGPRGGVRDGVKGRSVSYSTARGNVIEEVQCEGCPRTWKRVNA